MKPLCFGLIPIIESEKYGPRIPLNNRWEHYQACLEISIRSISNLKKEMGELSEQATQLQEQNRQDAQDDNIVYFFRSRIVTNTTLSS
jgi:hypothetical protein